VPHKYFRIDGVATYLHHRGPSTLPEVVPDRRQGERILCLHGAGGNGAVFDPLLDLLAERHEPLAFDQPGHGRSGALDSLGSIPRMAAFTRALWEKLALRAPVLLGHSMGGAVALQLALDHPDEVRGLVLVGAGARFDGVGEGVEHIRLVSEGKARREFDKEIYSPRTGPDVMKQGFLESLKTDPRAVYGDMLAIAECDLVPRLASVAVPTLVLVGEDEKPAMLEQAALLARDVPGARRVDVPAAGHQLHLEQPAALAAAIESFLAELT
jgi:pimeloyl-ACP methyl ester carboxylesterase